MQNDNDIITARFKLPIAKIRDFRDHVIEVCEDFSAEQNGSTVKVDLQINRAAARKLKTPDYAERI